MCNCKNTKWIVEKLGESLINQDQTICSTTSDTLEPLRGKPIRFFQPSEYCGLNVMLVFSIVPTGLAFVGIIVTCYHHRWFLKYKLFLLRLFLYGYKEIQDDRERDQFEYDVNIIFMDEDRDFAEEIFRPALIERLPHHVPIAFGDNELMLGMHYFDAVHYNVEKSVKNVLLISRVAVKDDNFMTKFRIAMNYVTDTQTQNMILVSLDTIPDGEVPYLLRLYLSGHGPFLRWQQSRNGQNFFWMKFVKHLNVNIRVHHVIPPYP